MKLSGLTYLDLLDLRKQVNDELENIANREKVKVFKIFSSFTENVLFLNEQKALDYLKNAIEDESFTFTEDGQCYIEIKYTDEANKQYCYDFDDKLRV